MSLKTTLPPAKHWGATSEPPQPNRLEMCRYTVWLPGPKTYWAELQGGRQQGQNKAYATCMCVIGDTPLLVLCFPADCPAGEMYQRHVPQGNVQLCYRCSTTAVCIVSRRRETCRDAPPWCDDGGSLASPWRTTIGTTANTHTRASPAQNKCTNLNEGLAQAASAATRVLPAITEQLELVLQPSRSIQLPYARTCSAENTASSLLAQQTASPSACQQRHRRRSHNNVAPAVATSCGMLPKNGNQRGRANPAALTTHVQARAIEDRGDVTGPVDVSDHQQGWLGAGRHSEADFGCPASRAAARGVEDYWCSSPCTIGIDCERLDRS